MPKSIRLAQYLLLAVLISLVACQPQMPQATVVPATVAPSSTSAPATATPVPPTPTPIPPTAAAPPPTQEPTDQPSRPDIVVQRFDLGEALLDQEWMGSSRFRELPVRLDGMIAAPATGDDLPLVVVLHGSHGSGCASTDGVTEAWPCPGDETPHYEGFAYLLEALAARGYVAIAINANPIYVMAFGEANTPLRAPVLLDLYMEGVAATISGDVALPGVDLAGRVDLSRLVLVGHSQGGTAIPWIARDRADHTSAAQIESGLGPVTATVLVAPADQGGSGRLGIPAAILLPACDRDVAGLDGQTIYELEQADGGPSAPIISVLLQWANHNRFNANLEDEWLARGSAACTPETLLPPELQQAFLAGYVPQFIDLALGHIQDGLELVGLDASRPAPATLYGREVLTCLALPESEVLSLPLAAGAATGPVTVTYCPQGYGGLDTGAEVCRRNEINQPGGPASWVASWEGMEGVYSVSAPGSTWDLAGYDVLHVRAAVDPLSELNREGQPQSFSLRIADGSGAAAAVSLRDEPALAFPYGAPLIFEDRPDQVLWDNDLFLSAIRVPLSTFAGVDLSDVASVSLVFDTTDSGTLFLTDLSAQRGAPEGDQ